MEFVQELFNFLTDLIINVPVFDTNDVADLRYYIRNSALMNYSECDELERLFKKYIYFPYKEYFIKGNPNFIKKITIKKVIDDNPREANQIVHFFKMYKKKVLYLEKREYEQYEILMNLLKNFIKKVHNIFSNDY